MVLEGHYRLQLSNNAASRRKSSWIVDSDSSMVLRTCLVELYNPARRRGFFRIILATICPFLRFVSD
ncbi:hypothetical protein POTOM_008287 [Populus tomentosa]|uniref:Uncharacterized protein n=1 Tax=Populus tomentosa TaxID=118781 RepID=A0A8X8DE18_POPTO|nr:hypothetical protein POTOM_008287 [Populus tomentosa]